MTQLNDNKHFFTWIYAISRFLFEVTHVSSVAEKKGTLAYYFIKIKPRDYHDKTGSKILNSAPHKFHPRKSYSINF